MRLLVATLGMLLVLLTSTSAEACPEKNWDGLDGNRYSCPDGYEHNCMRTANDPKVCYKKVTKKADKWSCLKPGGFGLPPNCGKCPSGYTPDHSKKPTDSRACVKRQYKSATKVGEIAPVLAVDYRRTPNAAISGCNDLGSIRGTVLACSVACSANLACKSFDYDKRSQKCDLSSCHDSNTTLKKNYSNNPYDHYSKKSIVATAKSVGSAMVSGYYHEQGERVSTAKHGASKTTRGSLRGTPAQCRTWCDEDWGCNSFSYNKRTRVCEFSSRVSTNTKSIRAKDYDYYARATPARELLIGANALSKLPRVRTTSLDTTPNPDRTSKDWMAQLANSTPLSSIAIPGTHDAGSRLFGRRVQTQTWTIGGQLDAGIRYLDIRVASIGHKLMIVHGITPQAQSLDSVLNQVRDFLKSHPGETIVMRVREDAGKNAAIRWRDYVRRYGSLFYQPAKDVDPSVALGKVRGRIVVLADAGIPTVVGFAYSSYGKGRSTGHYRLFNTQAKFEDGTHGDISLASKKTLVTAAIAMKGSDQLDKFPMIVLSGNYGMDPYNVAKQLNAHAYSRLASATGTSGLYIMDYPGTQLIDRIIKQNDARKSTESTESTKSIALKSAHGKYVVAEKNGTMRANRARLGNWEKFRMTTNGDGTVSFRSAHGKYLVAEPSGKVLANRQKVGRWEKFRMIKNKDGTVSFRSAHGKYLVAEPSGKLLANRKKIGRWEKFRLSHL